MIQKFTILNKDKKFHLDKYVPDKKFEIWIFCFKLFFLQTLQCQSMVAEQMEQ
jgi:hypothetical protein